MDIQTHSRTRQIKQLSRYLSIALTGLRYLLFLGLPGLVIVAFLPTGTLKIGNASVPLESTGFLLKAVILSLYACGLIIMIKMNHHFRTLMKQFIDGNIFGHEAIAQVRGALNSGIVFFVLSCVHALFGCIYNYSAGAPLDISFATEIVIACVFFGLMHTLLWALEIGCDLNEESEMTI